MRGMDKKTNLVITLLAVLLLINGIMAVVLIREKRNTDKAVKDILEKIDTDEQTKEIEPSGATDGTIPPGQGESDGNKQENNDYSEGGNEMQNNNSNQESENVRVTLCDGFYYEPISEELKGYMSGKSFQENDTIHYSDLRHVMVRYVDFSGQTREGELIVNVQVADDVLAIFKELYDASYQIEKIRLIDEYNADDDASMKDNNTSAFNYRTIDGTNQLSDHGYGIAVDINPLYNPYVREGYGDRNVLPVNGSVYADRSLSFEHKIEKGDICYQAFVSRGWEWGGEWDSPVDYQHFYKEIQK